MNYDFQIYNICNSGWVNNNNYYCVACENPCATCSVNTTHCDSCMDMNHIINVSFECICQDTYYSDTVNTCAPCMQPCSNCDINGCLTCIDIITKIKYLIIIKLLTSLKIAFANQVIMLLVLIVLNVLNLVKHVKLIKIIVQHVLMLIKVQQIICVFVMMDILKYQIIVSNVIIKLKLMQIQLPCTKCQFSNNYCLECLDPNHDLINNQCICKFGYGSSGNGGINCSQCQYPCLDCSTSISTCLSCIDSSLFHIEDNKCLCQQGYYQIETQCKKCSPQCLSCIDESDNCLKCSDLNHDYFQNTCICKLNYSVFDILNY